jgi:hypothetical protein
MSTKEGTTSACTSTSIAALPAEVLEGVLVYAVQTIRDHAACALTCKAFSRAAFCPRVLWRAIAVNRYGLEVAKASETLYDSDWEALVADDDKKGALPTLLDLKSCSYRANQPQYFFCCLIVAIKWNRLMGQIRIYLDARGESDMRPPDGSSVRMEYEGEGVASQITIRGQWVSELSQEETHPGHYKGYLAFNQNAFMAPGTYMFCYANLFHTMADYQSITIMDVPSTGGLADAFISSSSLANAKRRARSTYSTSASPFDKDTPESEHARWEKWVWKSVMKRHTRRRFFGGEPPQQWWV